MSKELHFAAKEFMIRYGGDVFPNLFKSAKGTIVVDDTGREILDFTSGQMCATIGHNHPAIVNAVNEAGKKAFHMFSGMIPEDVARLAKKIATEWMPSSLSKSIFINTGYEVLAVGGSWHGVTGTASSVSFASDRKGYGVPPPGVFILPEPNMYRPYIPELSAEDSALRSLEIGLKMFDMASTGKGAAIIVEPVISAGGVLVPPKSYMQSLRKAADDRGMLLIFDEAQTAFGRIGKKTGSELFGITPDIMTLSKTMGGGLPLAAVVTTPEIEEDIHQKGFSFYTSHVSDPLLAAVGLAVLDTIKNENLIEKANITGVYLRNKLLSLQDKYECIGEVRGEGLLLGVELVQDRKSKLPHHKLGELTTKKCFELGLSMNIRRRPERGSVWRIAPPLTVTNEEIDMAISILDKALQDSLKVL